MALLPLALLQGDWRWWEGFSVGTMQCQTQSITESISWIFLLLWTSKPLWNRGYLVLCRLITVALAWACHSVITENRLFYHIFVVFFKRELLQKKTHTHTHTYTHAHIHTHSISLSVSDSLSLSLLSLSLCLSVSQINVAGSFKRQGKQLQLLKDKEKRESRSLPSDSCYLYYK